MFDKNKVKLGIAPIAWTNDDLPDLGAENTFEQCVSEMALAGFTGSEVGNKYPKDPAELKKALDLRGIEICNQWFSSFLITKPLEEVEKEFRAQLEFLKAMGAKVIGASEQSYSVQGQEDTPVFGHKYVMDDEEWDTFCNGMNYLGKIAKERGSARSIFETYESGYLADVQHNLMLMDLLMYHPDDILVKVDRTAMAVSLESRVPMLDKDVVEFAWSLPVWMKWENGRGKLVLRDVLYRHVPRELMERPKKGFSIPIQKWLKEPELYAWAESLLKEDKIRQEGYFDPEMVTRLWKDFTQRGIWRKQIWHILRFEDWLEQEYRKP